jgi:hypothetical protein
LAQWQRRFRVELLLPDTSIERTAFRSIASAKPVDDRDEEVKTILLAFVRGSLEMFPTEEQVPKARLAYEGGLLISAILTLLVLRKLKALSNSGPSDA